MTNVLKAVYKYLLKYAHIYPIKTYRMGPNHYLIGFSNLLIIRPWGAAIAIQVNLEEETCTPLDEERFRELRLRTVYN